MRNSYHTVREVAAALKVTDETVRRWIREGKLNAKKIRGVGLKTMWGVAESDLDQFKAQYGG